MSETKPVGVVVNPVAGGGRMRTQWPAIKAALGQQFASLDIRQTRDAGDACCLARDMALDGAGLVIAVGGDGTISEVTDGLMQARAGEGTNAVLGIVPAGTGSDLARGLGIAGALSAVARIGKAQPRRIDVGRVDFIDDHGALASRHFINIASLGLSGVTARAVNGSPRGGQVSGRALFLWHTVRELIRYRFREVSVSVDGGEPVLGKVALVAVANGSHFGGGMNIAPGAAVDDGVLEVVIVRGVSKFTLLKDIRLVYSGAHRGHASCTFLRGKSITVEPTAGDRGDAPFLELDGESPGRIPATFTVLPGALELKG